MEIKRSRKQKFIGIETKQPTIQIESETQRNHPKIINESDKKIFTNQPEEINNKENLQNILNINNVQEKEKEYIHYSCIPQLEKNDISFEFKDIPGLINSNERRIPLHGKKENLNVSEETIKKEFNILYGLDNTKFKNMDLLEPGFKELNRYKDILPYKYNSIKISTEKGYINASPINIGDKKIYL